MQLDDDDDDEAVGDCLYPFLLDLSDSKDSMESNESPVDVAVDIVSDWQPANPLPVAVGCA